MSLKTTTYARVYFRGVAVDEQASQLVRDRDVRLVNTDGAYAVQFYEILSEVSKTTGKEEKTGPVHVSPKMYLGGRVYTFAQVMEEMPTETVLLSLMTINGWKKVIQTKSGHFLPFYDREDIIISS